mgnify:CR=1 FL=1
MLAEHPTRYTQGQEPSTLDPSNSISQESLRRLVSLPSLTPNWDGYGSPQITDIAINGAAYILNTTQVARLPQPYIGPVTGGGVQIEWHLPERAVELEVCPDGSVGYITIEGDEYSDDMYLPSYLDSRVFGLLNWLSPE